METTEHIYALVATSYEQYEQPITRVWHFSSEEKARQFYIDFKREIKAMLITSTRERFVVKVQKISLNPSHHMHTTENDYFKPLELENLNLQNHYS